MIIIQTNSLPLHLKSAFFGFNKAEYRTSLVSKSLPIKNPIFATHSNSATKTMHNVFHNGIISCNEGNCGVTKLNKRTSHSVKKMPSGSNIILEWSVIDGKEEDAVEKGMVILEVFDEKTAFITFKEPNLYTVICNAYIKNTYDCVGHAEYQQPLTDKDI